MHQHYTTPREAALQAFFAHGRRTMITSGYEAVDTQAALDEGWKLMQALHLAHVNLTCRGADPCHCRVCTMVAEAYRS